MSGFAVNTGLDLNPHPHIFVKATEFRQGDVLEDNEGNPVGVVDGVFPASPATLRIKIVCADCGVPHDVTVAKVVVSAVVAGPTFDARYVPPQPKEPEPVTDHFEKERAELLAVVDGLHVAEHVVRLREFVADNALGDPDLRKALHFALHAASLLDAATEFVGLAIGALPKPPEDPS